MQRAFRAREHADRERRQQAAVPAGASLEPHVARTLALQQTAGNTAVARLIARAGKPAVKKSASPWPVDTREVDRWLRQSKQQAAKEAHDLAILTLRARGSGSDAANKKRALAHAWDVSYAMTAKSSGESWKRSAEDVWAGVWGTKGYKPARVQSVLGGSFLRMYLAGKTDPDIIEAAGEELVLAPEFAKLQTALQTFLAKQKLPADAAKAEAQLKKSAQTYFDWRLTKKGGGIAFRYELNPVIGGVGGVTVDTAKVTETPDPKGRKIDYRLEVTFKDAYDFQNARSGEYEKYRKKLAALLTAAKYEDFWEAYGREAFAIGPKTSLDQASIFASYMYAIESKGWTPGSLKWEVTVPMTGSFVTAAAPKAAPKPTPKKKLKKP
jgi:hypothetical protein